MELLVHCFAHVIKMIIGVCTLDFSRCRIECVDYKLDSINGYNGVCPIVFSDLEFQLWSLFIEQLPFSKL